MSSPAAGFNAAVLRYRNAHGKGRNKFCRFEDRPATDLRADQLYLDHAAGADICIGLFGGSCGYLDARGTRGVFVSMSGYTQDIGARILRGRQISQVGLTHGHLMAVVEGRATWTDLVLEAHRNLAMRHMFVALPAEQLLLGASTRGRDG